MKKRGLGDLGIGSGLAVGLVVGAAAAGVGVILARVSRRVDYEIVINGQPFAVDFEVSHSLSLEGIPRPRRVPIDLIVLHDSAGENGAERVHETLVGRGFSIHFYIDKDGLVWQFMDPALFFAEHIGHGFDKRSIGIEMQNAVFPPGVTQQDFANPRHHLTGDEPTYGRDIIIEPYRGRTRRVLAHTAIQREIAILLVDALLDAFPSIPRTAPTTGVKLAADYAGVAGHLHLTDDHADPAQDVLADLLAA